MSPKKQKDLGLPGTSSTGTDTVSDNTGIAGKWIDGYTVFE